MTKAFVMRLGFFDRVTTQRIVRKRTSHLVGSFLSWRAKTRVAAKMLFQQMNVSISIKKQKYAIFILLNCLSFKQPVNNQQFWLMIEYWLWASKQNKNDKTLYLGSFRFCLNLIRKKTKTFWLMFVLCQRRPLASIQNHFD